MALSQIVISGNSTFPVRTARKTAIWQSFFCFMAFSPERDIYFHNDIRDRTGDF